MIQITKYKCTLSRIKTYCLQAAECETYSPLSAYIMKVTNDRKTIETFDSEEKAKEEFSKYAKGIKEEQPSGFKITVYALERIENKKVKEVLQTSSFERVTA